MGYLSQIENDKASPSLESLAALAEAIEVPITWFLLDWTPSGRLRATQGEFATELGPGDYLLWDATIPHDAEAVGEGPTVLLIVSHRAPGTETAPRVDATGGGRRRARWTSEC